jgi:hypothetical protein
VKFSSKSLIIFPTNTRYLILFTSCKCLLPIIAFETLRLLYLWVLPWQHLLFVVLGMATMGSLVDLNCLVLTLFPLCLCFVCLIIYFVYVLKCNAPLNNVKYIMMETMDCIHVIV